MQGFPTHHQLSEISPENPVLLTHASGHAAFANKKAMELSGITKDTPNPAGRRDRQGREGRAGRRVARDGAAPRPARRRASARAAAEELAAEARKVVDLASQECLTKGVTSVQDAGSSLRDVDLFKKVADEGKLGVSVSG